MITLTRIEKSILSLKNLIYGCITIYEEGKTNF